jgi:hypothetical protein
LQLQLLRNWDFSNWLQLQLVQMWSTTATQPDFQSLDGIVFAIVAAASVAAAASAACLAFALVVANIEVGEGRKGSGVRSDLHIEL